MSCRDALGNRCNHKVRLHFFSISVPRVLEFTALRNAQRVYGANGISIQMVSGQSLYLTQQEQLTLNVIDGACKWDVVSDEQRLLHSLGGSQRVLINDIRVYYVNKIATPSGSLLNGCAGHAPHRPAVAIAATGSPWTLAHEVGHVLLGSAFQPVHSTSRTNLMYAPTASITGNPPDLTRDQLLTMINSRYCVSC